jgi:hypothetical protein
MGVVLNFVKALADKAAEANTEKTRRQKNAELIARYRPRQKPRIDVVDPTCDLRAMQESTDKSRLGLVHFRTDEDEFPPPAG